MKDEKQPLSKAIKENYSEQPLKIELAAAVTDKVFPARHSTSLVDLFLYILGGMIVALVLVLTILFLSTFSTVSYLAILFVPVFFYFGLAFKEMSMLAERVKKMGV